MNLSLGFMGVVMGKGHGTGMYNVCLLVGFLPSASTVVVSLYGQESGRKGF